LAHRKGKKKKTSGENLYGLYSSVFPPKKCVQKKKSLTRTIKKREGGGTNSRQTCKTVKSEKPKLRGRGGKVHVHRQFAPRQKKASPVVKGVEFAPESQGIGRSKVAGKNPRGGTVRHGRVRLNLLEKKGERGPDR